MSAEPGNPPIMKFENRPQKGKIEDRERKENEANLLIVRIEEVASAQKNRKGEVMISRKNSDVVCHFCELLGTVANFPSFSR